MKINGQILSEKREAPHSGIGATAASMSGVQTLGNSATVVLTFYAQENLRDIVFVELPAVGARLSTGTTMGGVESVSLFHRGSVRVKWQVSGVVGDMAKPPSLVW
ncbi:hypothetical protein ACFYN3_42280 [Streptomyces lavendulae]|uniref:hypothetical protein n=1 Tax=Streptomyces lavendulae TaxID=1914 RepID=UPI0036CDF083